MTKANQDLLETTCRYCGEERELFVSEWYPAERLFNLGTCCEGYYEAMIDELNCDELAADKTWRRGFCDWFAAETGVKPRRVYGEDGQLRLDYGLRLEAITLKDAKQFVRDHHHHVSNPPCSWRWGHALYNGDELVAIAMVGRPVARKIDHTQVVEVNRLCVNHDLDSALAWNACSLLYATAAKEAKRRGYREIVTYTLETEKATTLKAVGWDRQAVTKGGSWNRKSRPRIDKAPTCKKVRWGRELRRAA